MNPNMSPNSNPNALPRSAGAVRDGAIDGLQAYMRAIYNMMAGGLAVTGAVAWLSFDQGLYQRIAGTPLIWVALLAPLVMVIFLSVRIQKMSLSAARMTYWSYAALMGVSLAGIFLMYAHDSIARVFFITAGTFGAMSFYGYTTKKDLTGWGSFLMMGLIGVIIASVVNLFLKSSALQFAVSVAGVVVFVGLTAYDTQKIKAIYAEGEAEETVGKKVVMGALTLYLDFINLFLMLLRLFGNRR